MKQAFSPVNLCERIALSHNCEAMPEFDFIHNNEFREALERDYQELRKSFDVGAWKSVHVLAGSIIEAVLVDYLLATPNPLRVAKDPLKVDLADAIAICRSEDVISQRTSELCSVIRSYRNLIHPGRAVRLNEPPANEESARIALSLIGLIVEDVIGVRQRKFGFTAKQMLNKIESDPSCLPILRHLLDDMQEAERDKLILDAIPRRYLELALDSADDFEVFTTLGILRKAYLTARMVASQSALERAATDYVKVLKEGDSNLVVQYDEAFFRAEDLQHVPESSRRLVKKHLLSTVGFLDSTEKLARLRGIEQYLEPDEVSEWLVVIIRPLISTKTTPKFKGEVRAYMAAAPARTSKPTSSKIEQSLNAWAKSLREEGRVTDAEELERLEFDWSFPF